MRQGRLELRSGAWEWSLLEPESTGGGRRLRFRSPVSAGSAAPAAEEMVVRVEREPDLSPERIRRLATHAPTRRFTDEEGVLWTAEAKAPRLGAGDPEPAPMVLFSCEQHACLITLKPARGLGELTREELQTLLQECLDG